MRLINGNVERISETEAQTEKWKAAGFRELKEVKNEAAGEKVSRRASREKNPEKKKLDGLDLAGLQELAKEKGLEGYASLTEEELRTILRDGVE